MATATVTPGYNWTSGEVVTVNKMNLAATPTVTTELSDGEVTGAKVANATLTNAKFAGSVGLNAWQTRSANYTAAAGDRINANTSGGAFTITLPATPATYTEVTLADQAGTWATNNLTVARNGQSINGGNANLICDVSAKQFTLRFEGAAGWRVYT
jgi:hypothetical protein